MRRVIAALIIVVILAGAWAGGWFWLAGWVDRNAEPALERIARRGIDVECPNRDVVGFPFALRVECGASAVAERSTGTRASLAGATGGASVFRPMTAEFALQAPVSIRSPLLEAPLELSWDQAAVDLGMGLSGPRTVSFDAQDFLGAFAAPGLPEQTVAATRAEAHLEPSASGGSAITLNFVDFGFTTGETRFPPVSGSVAAELSVPPSALAGGRAAVRLPLTAEGIEVMIQSGGARFTMEGDVSVGPGGSLDGALMLRVAGAEALPAFIAALPQEFQRIGNAIAAGLFAFGKPTTLNGEQASEVRVTIVDNRATIGPVEFDLPRLRL